MTDAAAKDPRLLFFAGSARLNSFNKRLAKLGAMIAEANSIPSTFVDLADYPMPIYHGDLEEEEGPPDNARKLKNLMRAHTGIFIVSPEYNASFSPLLKNVIDWVSHTRDDGEAPLEVFRTRVFALASASGGGLGGLRGLMQLRAVLELGTGALVLPEQFALPRVREAFDDNGHLKNKDQTEQLKSVIQKLARAARVLHG
ncbi:NADPH-dependent FMN reductase [Hyphomicrobium sp. ghe19]|uniref:NADPH-dependent FMN reductase n=1 Tax=Hyphomicrobium sp. ghe19 TaxID=2682968 RepID=UPI0013679472|nr:Chromate reductase [Hyphomicrobium sp. ghe19]